jgi:NADH:ubiquinone oxidoreductase subunit F (NADH-binding)
MMNRFVRHLLKIGVLMRDLCVSAVGCFVFLRGFRLVASKKEESAVESSIRVDGTLGKPLAGTGAALFLLTFVTSEALVMIRALCR